MTTPDPWRGDVPDPAEIEDERWHEMWDLPESLGWPEELAGPEYWLYKGDDTE